MITRRSGFTLVEFLVPKPPACKSSRDFAGN